MEKSLSEYSRSHRRYSMKKDVLKNFANFTGKIYTYTCVGVCFDKVAEL